MNRSKWGARNSGPDHPEVGGRAANLAFWLIEEGEFDEASALVEEALNIRRQALGPKHPQFASTITIKAYLMLSTGRFKEAYELAELARTTLAEALPAGSWQIAAAMNVEGAALTRLGRFKEAEPLLLASQEGLAKAPIPNLARIGKQRLVELYERWGKPAEAQKVRAKT